jgi:Zn-dependent M28 family amino/carboxypeptidase
VVIGAHYDSRIYADEDPNPQNRKLPVPAANDGASGVAVLLELARVLPRYMEQDGVGRIPGDVRKVTLLFIDVEDNWNIPGWDGELGSQAYVDALTSKPDAAVIIDMIGDADLNIYKELNSDPKLTQQIWDAAKQLGYEQYFIPQPKYRMIDDHLPFLHAGIPAVDIIDFDYPYWHTLADTPDKVSAHSMTVVGETLIAWLTGNVGK